MLVLVGWVLRQCGVQAITLYGSLDPRQRERWIEDHGCAGTLITNPRLVQTGLDLVGFQPVKAVFAVY